jgi:hypothetical protein
VTATETAYAAYLVAKANASQGGVDLTSIRNSLRADLVALLRALLSNINAIADGDVDKLLSSGFPLRNTNPSPVGQLGPPTAVTVSQGELTGTLKAGCNRVYGAVLYTARLALASAPTVILQTKQGTATRFLFEQLIPGELYNVDRNAIGAAR